jgi:hypothetical protein
MDQIDKHLIETVKSIVNPPDIDTTDRDIIVSEYVQSYFGDALNEGVVGGDDIREAFDELLETADAVAEFIAELGPRTAERAGRAVASTQANTSASPSKLAQAKRVAKKISQREPAQIGGSKTQQEFNRGVRRTNLKRQGLDPNTPMSRRSPSKNKA